MNDILAKSLSFYQEGKYHKAYSYCQLVFQYLEDDLPKSLKGRCYLYIGNFAVEAEHYEKAIQHFEEGLSIFKADEDKRNTAIIHNSLAVVFEKMGKYDLSLKYNFRYLDYLIAQNDSAGLTSAYNNLGNSYMGLEDYNVARTYYLKAFQIDSIKNDSLSLSADYNNLGIVFSKLQDYKTAIAHYKKALEIDEHLSNGMGQCIDKFNIGLSNLEANNLLEAEQYLSNSYKLAVSNGSLTYIQNTSEKLSILYEKLGGNKRALAFMRTYNLMNDSINNKTKVALQYAKNQETVATSNEKLDTANSSIKNNEKLGLESNIDGVFSNLMYVLIAIATVFLLIVIVRLFTTN